MIILELPFPPSVNAMYKNVAKGRAKTRRYLSWSNEAGWIIKNNRPQPVKGWYELTLVLFEKDQRRRDPDNFVKPVSDLLVAHGLVEDDSLCLDLRVGRKSRPDKGCKVAVRAVAPKNSPLPGAASNKGGVFFKRTAKPKAEVINDINRNISTLFRILQRHYPQFLDTIKFQITSRAEFNRLVDTNPNTLTDLERAARFLYLQKTAFGGKISGYNFGVAIARPARFNLTTLEPMLEAVHERLSGVVIENLDWKAFIERYDRPEIVKTFKTFNQKPVELTYSINMGGKRKHVREMIVSN